ncbi:enolase-phosphatase E1 [Drosophila obscura]|uniref:enolase-phosphatase E1 n=1 Tax=Drosophila obscura TaxID=7282 RepID=UPI001BB1B884|nr:enolase-phosphatase E1 [Drosophila obscura]
MLGDDDDLNIYGDLDDFQNAEEKKSKELQAWETQCKGAQAEIECLKVENKALNKKIRAMEVNLQNLMDTAKAEIKRKESLITQLRKEKDDLCFRRKRGRADEDPKAAGQEHKRSKLSEPVTNKFKTALGNESKNTNHENERPRMLAEEHVTNKFKTVVPTDSKSTEHKRPKLLAEPATNKLKAESQEPRKHKLEETVTNKFRIEPRASDKMNHQKSSTGGESRTHDNKDSKRTNRSRSPREDRHRRERRRSRSRSAKRSHRHEHHRGRQSKDRSSKRRSVSRSPNRTAAAKQSARQPDDRSKRTETQKEATVTTLFGEETNDQVLASPNLEMIKKMKSNTSPATSVELYTPESQLQAPIRGGDKPAKNEEISISDIDGYFQVNPLAKHCSLPASQVIPETLEQAEPKAGAFSWASNFDKQLIPGLDMICQLPSPIKNTTQQPEDVNLGTQKIDAIEDCIIDHTEEVNTRHIEDCKPTESMGEMEQESLSLEPVPAIPEAPIKDEGSPMDIEIPGTNITPEAALHSETPSKDEDISMDIEAPSLNLTPESEEKEETQITTPVDAATAQVDDASPELMKDAVDQATGAGTPTKRSDTILDDDCPTPRRPSEITEDQASEEIKAPTKCSAMNTILNDDCPPSGHASQITEVIEIIEDIRLPAIVDIENIAITVDVPFDSSEMTSDGNSESQDLNVVDGKIESEAELPVALDEDEDMQIEQETFGDETAADGLEDEPAPIERPVIAAQGLENEITLAETPAFENLFTETPAIETLPTATHGSENDIPEAETPVIEAAVTETKNEMDIVSMDTPASESPQTLVTEIPFMETPVVAVYESKNETCAMETPETETTVAAVYESNDEILVVETAAVETPVIEETPDIMETFVREIPFMETPVVAVYESRIECNANETAAIQSTGIEIPILPPHGSIHDSLIVAATSKPSSILYAQPDSTKTDNSEDMVLEAAMNELTGEQEPVPSAANTSYPNLTLAEDTIEMALQQLHQTSPDETKVTSTSNKSQKSPQKDLAQILTASPLQLSPAKSTPKGRKTTPEKLRVEKTPLKKRKIHMPEDLQTDELLVPQTPPPSQPSIAHGIEASPTLEHVTIDETLDESPNRSFGSDTSVVTKRCSMGSTDYQFERINDEIVLRVSRRKRRPRPSPAPLDDGEKSAGT